MNRLLLITLFFSFALCEDDKLLADDFKCSLPDVTSIDANLDIHRFRQDFAKVSEVKFPGLIGPLNERLICKIKCVDGNWVGPLCSPTQNGRFQPILRECLFTSQNPNLYVTYKNKTVLNDTWYPHGSELITRCADFGLYKILGDQSTVCDNGVWSNKLPTCIPTSVLTNYTGGAPPTIQFTVAAGSAVVDARGELLIYPGSTVWLDCLWPRGGDAPEWTWSNPAKNTVNWSGREGEGDHFRVTLTRATPRHGGSYTCTAPGGSTNTAFVKVVNIVCPPRVSASPHLRTHAQGTRLGSAIQYSCKEGYHLKGSAIANCMGDGQWSTAAPTCEAIVCPELRAAGSFTHLSDYNKSVGGRAVIACAWGYRLVGAPGLECEPDGRWSDAVPTCVPIYCPEPPNVPELGRLTKTHPPRDGKHPVGHLLLYYCEAGYQLVGENSIVCTESGFWSHPPPFCMRPSEVRKSDTIVVDNITFVNFNE
ncbi:locomotion-related protein Hikaru genki [Bicyclus anynana]|uniref:Locomotion-related protein Hikaru genki n=1 Tax=Bicyclus anynana TaxID=110368 RepID=A0A6J1NJK0_BICAN|nr:locomotion-related protein Hikaru genki [Bicyclus anynana]